MVLAAVSRDDSLGGSWGVRTDGSQAAQGTVPLRPLASPIILEVTRRVPPFPLLYAGMRRTYFRGSCDMK